MKQPEGFCREKDNLLSVFLSFKGEESYEFKGTSFSKVNGLYAGGDFISYRPGGDAEKRKEAGEKPCAFDGKKYCLNI